MGIRVERERFVQEQGAVEHNVEICRDLLGTCEYIEKRIATLIQVVCTPFNVFASL